MATDAGGRSSSSTSPSRSTERLSSAGGRSTTKGLPLLVYALPALAALALTGEVLASTRAPAALELALALTLAAGAGLAELFPVRLAPNQKGSLASVPLLLGAFLLPPALAGSVAATAMLAGNLAAGRRRWSALFNAANATLCSVLAAHVALGGGSARLLGAAIGFWLLGLILATGAAARQNGDHFWPRLFAALRASWTQALAFSAIAATSASLAHTLPSAAVMPLLLLPLVYRMNQLLEAELAGRERMQGVLAAQRRFLTDVAHNVGNPLTTIRTNLSLIRAASLPFTEKQALEDAAGEARRLGELFLRLRLLAETDEGLPLRKQRVDLVQIAGDLLRAYGAEATWRGVSILVDAPARTDVEADEDLIRQAVGNLLENALRVTPVGAAVTLRVGREAGLANLDVIDQGPGVAPDLLPSIFERFRKGPGGGSGLGLSIARSVVERHGGEINVESSPGSGSRFRISLPAAN